MRMSSSLATNQSAASNLKDQLKRSSLGGGSNDDTSGSNQPLHQRSFHECILKMYAWAYCIVISGRILHVFTSWRKVIQVAT